MTSDRMFAAFIAGFEASGEGFNGEYVGDRYRGRGGVPSPEFIEHMREDYEEWLERTGVSVADVESRAT